MNCRYYSVQANEICTRLTFAFSDYSITLELQSVACEPGIYKIGLNGWENVFPDNLGDLMRASGYGSNLYPIYGPLFENVDQLILFCSKLAIPGKFRNRMCGIVDFIYDQSQNQGKLVMFDNIEYDFRIVSGIEGYFMDLDGIVKTTAVIPFIHEPSLNPMSQYIKVRELAIQTLGYCGNGVFPECHTELEAIKLLRAFKDCWWLYNFNCEDSTHTYLIMP